MDLSPLYISLKIAFTATVITFVLGILAAWLVLGLKRGKGLLDGLFSLPLVLPPTVVGFFLLVLCGKNGLVGTILSQLSLSVVFTWMGAVLASVVVSFPLMYRTTRGAMEQVDRYLIYAGRTLGMSEWKIFYKILIPAAWPGIMAGTILAFARALGEFGATIMLAGNIPGETQTMSVAVYTAVQGGNRELAYQWVLIIVSISLTMILLMNYCSSYQKKYQKTHRKKHQKTYHKTPV